MPRIMCTQTLWRRLGKRGRPPYRVTEPVIQGASLGSWAAKVFRLDGRDLVLALNERTYLTVVFPLAPRRAFRSQFAAAVANALEDLGLPRPIIQAESMAVEFQPLTQMTSSSMAQALSDVEFVCGIELCYHSDLRTIQRNLNALPHPDREPCVPVDAVNQLFDAVPPGPRQLAH